MKRVFIIVLDSVGVGELPDAADYKDCGSNTLLHVSKYPGFSMPNMKEMGFFAIPGTGFEAGTEQYKASYGKMREASRGKDTTTGHWEIAGIVSQLPLPVYPDGFPQDVIAAFEKETGRKTLCNLPYSGTEVIKEYGAEHEKTGALIVYTSADSVFQIAAHEDIVPVEELYRYCEIARQILVGEHNVGRVIARPFTGTYPNYERTPNRHDFSVHPPKETMLDYIKKSDMQVLSVGKIIDIFAGDGITKYVRTVSNEDGMDKTLLYMEETFDGLCFVNLVDFDMKYGHRNDVEGYAEALMRFDTYVPEIIKRMRREDLLIITADHGCDPTTKSTDHSREYVPVILYGAQIKGNNDIGIRNTFADIAKTVLDYLGVQGEVEGTSMLPDIQIEKK